MPEKILAVSGLKVKFGRTEILKGITFTVEKGDTVAVIGPNGAGKTVLFKAILGLIPFSGEVSWAVGTKIGYVPQRVSVPPDLPLTVGEFLSFKEPKSLKLKTVLEAVGLKKNNFMNYKMANLSGGEVQRVFIANAILGSPQVLLFDEPTTGVDLLGEETVYSLIEKLKKQSDLTIIFISHELEIVSRYANKVFCLNKEKICFGAPAQVIDQTVLNKMYGETISFYHHHE